ncbi:MAG: hypothetical protein LAT62_03050 [Natronospirillum sp.]|uniref:YhdP family phospholipid transporter n=1 Tax=Natronospirillum sp. TaxID=2812955 RepID=UPI0025EC9DAC|nr:AsmA-like C-terminal region-containing protein [Natronospirillum sp.]MCH8550886.1 hypothetical protein [Natronospirillum sp.]
MSARTTLFNLRRAVWRSMALLALLMVVYVIAGRQLAPMVERTTPTLESYFSELLEQPVSIAGIQGEWRGFGPVFTVRGLSIGDSFELTSVTLEPALLTSLAKQNVIFNRFQVNGGRVEAVQDGDRWQVPAFAILERDVQLREVFETAYNQLLEQDAIRLRDMVLTLTSDDESLDILLADALIIGTHEYHELSGELIFDPEGQAVTAGLQIEARDTRNNPDVYAYLRHDTLDLSPFRGALPDLPDFELNQLELAANWWLRWRDGRLQYLQADLQQANLRFRAPNDEAEQSLQDLSAALHWEPGGEDEHRVRLRDISFSYNDQTWLPSSHDIALSPDGLTVDTSQLSVVTLGAMVEPWLPVDLFTRHSIRGQVNDLALHIPRIEGDWDLEGLSASGLIRNGEFGHLGQIPGFDQVDARFSAGLRQGVVSVEPGPLQVRLPNSLPEPILMDVRAGSVAWHLSEDLKLQIASSEVDFDWRDSGRVLGRFAFSTAMDPERESAAETILSLALAGERLHTESLFSGLPIQLPANILDWMHTRLQDVEGGPWAIAMPNIFADDLRTRIGKIGADVASATIEIDENWPEFEQVGGNFFLDHNGINARLDTGQYAELTLDQGRLRLPFVENTSVFVSGYSEAEGRDAWQLVTDSPVRDMVPPEILNWQLDGRVSGDLDLRIPLFDAPVELELAMTVQDSELVMPTQNLRFNEINGPLFLSTQRGLRSPGLQAELFGGPLAASMQTEVLPDGAWRLYFPGQGLIPLAELGLWLQDPWLASQSASIDYQGELSVQEGSIDLQASSDLRGLALDFPEPLGKQAAEGRPLDLQLTLREGDHRIRANYDDALDIDLRAGADWIPRAGAIQLGDGEPGSVPDNHIQLGAQLPEINVQAWAEAWAQIQPLYALPGPLAAATLPQAEGEGIEPEVEGPPVPVEIVDLAPELLAPSGLRALLDALADTRLHEIRAQTDSLLLGDYQADGGTMTLEREAEQWVARVDSRRVGGTLSVPDQQGEPTLLALDFLHLGDLVRVILPAVVEDATALDDEPLLLADVRRRRDPYQYDPDQDWLAQLDPTWLPHMEIEIDNLTYNAESFGEWAFALSPRAEGLRVDRINGDVRGVNLNGYMEWQTPLTGQHSSSMNLRASTGDLADVLVASGLTPVITSNRAQGSAELSWQGSPLAFDGRGVRGQVGFDVRDGNLRELEDFDAIRVIGLLNVTRIFRRLALDFRDVFSAGISYDRIRGDLLVEEGLVSVGERLSLDGSGARMFFGGDYDMLQDELDAEGVVIARVSNTAGLLALGAGFSPPVALMVIFGERAFERELERLFSVRTEISGPLARPDVRASRLFDSDIRGNEATLEERMRELFGPDAR